MVNQRAAHASTKTSSMPTPLPLNTAPEIPTTTPAPIMMSPSTIAFPNPTAMRGRISECPQVAERPQADVHEEHDRHGEGDQGELQKQPEMTAVDHEGAVEDLPEVHGTDVGHLPLAPIAGWR